MPISHLLLALSVVFIWGTNFPIIRIGLADFPPFLFSALRFLLSAVPWIFLFPRPKAPWQLLAGVGLLLGCGQFGLLYWALQHDITPGLASLVIQSQVFFTIIMAMILARERLTPLQIVALLLAVGGYAVVAGHIETGPGAAVTVAGLLLVLAAALSWACANMLVRRAGRVDAAGFMAWSSLYASLPLGVLCLVMYGPGAIAGAIAHAGWPAWGSLFWQALGNTVYGFGVWNWLLARHPAAIVTPTALLVPVFGMLSSALILAEPLAAWKLWAAALVLSGLALNMHAGRAAARAMRRARS